MESRERIVIRDGKPIYSIRIDTDVDKNKSYVYIKYGITSFSDSYFSTNNDFDFGNGSHRIANEIFKNLGVKDLIKKPIEKQSNKFLEIFKRKESK